MAEIWNEGAKLCDFNPNRAPQIGDVIELTVGGEKRPYEIAKAYHYYPSGSEPVKRIEVSACRSDPSNIAQTSDQ